MELRLKTASAGASLRVNPATTQNIERKFIMYCPECGELMDDCRCDLELEQALELMFDEENQELPLEGDY